ncbi:MAG: O-acetylhomoserine aminocarboxypropyltransferase/cysteine synthase family protein [Peptostreptococcaceae bacterium]
MSKNYSKETLCIRGGYKPEIGDPMALPIVQSTTFRHSDPDLVADLFDLKAEGHMYTRISNPTVDDFEKKLAQLEGGVGAVAVSSGQSAVLLAILNICKTGDKIIASSALYGGTFNLLNITLRNLGIETTFVDLDISEDELISLVDDKTKIIYGEIIGNPGLDIFDFEKFSNVCKKVNLPLFIDNTVASPSLCNPFEYGANIVIHSTSKYIDGHAVALGGAVVDGGNFDWDNGKFEVLVEPDPSYHGIKYVETFNESAYITKLRVSMLRDIGSCMSPFNAFLTNLGLETLHLRMQKHSENALKLGEYLQNHEKVSWVSYPLLKTQKDYDKAVLYLKDGASGILTFGIKGGVNEAKSFIKNLELVDLAIHLGFNKTSVLHPASTTHSQLTEKEQIKCGVSPDLIRVSVGIENIDDIINDFNQALNKL